MAHLELLNVPSVQVLIDQVASFAAANGWEVVRNSLNGTYRTLTVRRPGESDYVHLFNTSAVTLRSRISVGYSASEAPEAQPNVSPADGMSDLDAGPYPKVRMFCTGPEFHLAVLTAAAGQYRHHAFGVLDKAGAYVGGTYADGTYWASSNYAGFIAMSYGNRPLYGGTYYDACGHVRADSAEDGRANSFHQISNYARTPLGVTGTAFTGIGSMGIATGGGEQIASFLPGRLLGGADDNHFSGRSIFHPIRFSVQRVGTGVYQSPIGTLRGTRFCSLAKFDVEQEVDVDGDTWVVFPLLRKSSMSTEQYALPSSGNYGFAIKK